MSKLITEIVRRQCCQPQDLIPARGSKKSQTRGVPDRVFCTHCKKKFIYTRFTDAAGSMDWEYREVKK